MADDFGFGEVMKTMESSQQLTLERQRLQREQQERTNAANTALAGVQRKSSDVTQGLMDDLTPMLGQIAELEQGARVQNELKSSGEIGDFLQYVGNQVLDPGKYTRAGRQKALAETTQMMNVKTQVANLQQAALTDLGQTIQADLVASGAELSMAALLEAQSQERLTAEVTRVQQQSNFLQANRALAENKLSMMSAEEVRAAAAQAKGQPIDIGGVMISPGDLESRLLVLDDRDYLMQTRAAAEESGKAELVERVKRKQLENMNETELRQLQIQGSDQYDIKMIEDVYRVKKAAVADDIAAQTQLLQLGDFGASVIVPEKQMIDRMAPVTPRGSALESALKGHNSLLTGILTQEQNRRDSGVPTTEREVAAAAIALEASREALNKAIDKEAILKSKGDDNLRQIYVELFRGNPVPQASVENALMERLDKGRSLDDVLPAEVGRLVQDTFNTRYQELLVQNQTNFNVDKKQLKQQAMQEALVGGITNSITARTNELITNPIAVPGNPLAGVIRPEQMFGMVAEADARGIQAFQSAYGLTDEEMQTVLQGQPVPGKVDGAAGNNLNVIQNQELYLALDAKEAGLAKRYADWWAENGNAYINEMRAKRLEQARSTGVQDSALEVYASTIEAEQTAVHMMNMATAYESYEGVKYQRYKDMITFDLNPGHRQAVLLQLDDSLNDTERKTFMRDFIMPIIKQGQEKNLSYENINIAVEKAIDANLAPNAELAKLLKKVAKERPAISTKIESVTGNVFWRAEPGQPRMGFQPQAWARRSAAGYDWYQDVLEGK